MSSRKPSSEITIDVSGMGDHCLLGIYEAVRDLAGDDGGTNDDALKALEDWLIYKFPVIISDIEADMATLIDPEGKKEALARVSRMCGALEEIDARRRSPIADAVSDYLGNAASDVEIGIFTDGAQFYYAGGGGDYWRGMFRAAAELAAAKIAPDVPGAESREIVKAIYDHYGLPY